MTKIAERCGRSKLDTKTVGDGKDVLVATAAHIHHNDVVARQGWRNLGDMGQRVGRLKRRDDAFEAARQLKCFERLAVSDRDVLDTPDVVQPGVLRAYAGIIETGGDRVRVADLPVVVLQ